MTRLELRNVVKRYGATTVLRDVSLCVEPGEFLTVVGPSGCGKSTLLRIVAGLVEPTSGEVRLDGQVANGWEPRRRDVAMVFQNYALYPHLSVERNLAFPLVNRRLPRAEVQAKVRATAALLGLAGLLGRKPAELSGGQMQRVALGRAIVRDPRLFLFDEPLSNLDPALRSELRSEIAELQRRLRITTVYVTHDQAEALSLGTRVCVLREGSVEQLGSPRAIWERPESVHVAGLLGSPPMNLLRLPLEQGRVRLGRLQLEVPLGGEAAQVVLGLRPHEISLGQDLEARVDGVEEQGDRRVLECSAGELRLRVVGSFPPWIRPGERLGLGLGAAPRHWFDARTGRRLGDLERTP